MKPENRIPIPPEVLAELDAAARAGKSLGEFLEHLASAPPTPAPKIDPVAIREESEECFNAIDLAKYGLAKHCFRLMLSEGLTWSDILSTIGDRLLYEGRDAEIVDQLKEMGQEIALTPSDFS